MSKIHQYDGYKKVSVEILYIIILCFIRHIVTLASVKGNRAKSSIAKRHFRVHSSSPGH